MAEFISAFTLPGTVVGDITNDLKELAARTHRLSANAENEIELWYYRNGGWTLFPIQPLTGPAEGIELTQVYKQPYTLGFTLPDPNGLYSPENKNSAFNFNSNGVYDPLLDEARKIVCRVGTHCYTNLAFLRVPTITGADSVTNSLNLLTDGVLGSIASGTASYVKIGLQNTSCYVTVDLGSVQAIKHAVIRFASFIGYFNAYNPQAGVCSFPTSVQLSVSTDNATWTDLPVRPVGYNGRFITTVGEATTFTPGDWEESTSGQTIEVAFCDLDTSARYVRFLVTNKKYGSHLLGDPAPNTICVDELAVYGGSQYTVLGANVFTGYLGDQIEIGNDGKIRSVAVDTLKKLADNQGVFLTAAYRMTSAGAIELGDIVHSLLTSSAYWRNKADYDAPLTNAEVGWSSGASLTGLQYPLWQGQGNSMLGYCQELFNAVGWNLYADGNGVIQASEPPYTQRLPDRVCIAANDGNYDVADCFRHRTGKQMRNEVIVQTGRGDTTGSGTLTQTDPNSVARYGTRETRITDPLAATVDLRLKVAAHFLRDYAWNLQTLSCVIRPQFETKIKQVFGFRAPARPNLYPYFTDPDAAPTFFATQQRLQELWSLVSLTHKITHGQWLAQAEWIPYVTAVPPTVDFTALTTPGAFPDRFTIAFTPIDPTVDKNVVAVRIYTSTTGTNGTFTLFDTINFSLNSVTYTGQPVGETLAVYLVSVDSGGNESYPSKILTVTLGGSGEADSDYAITDFAVGSILSEGPDASGYYTYQFEATWTAPAAGFTQDDIRAMVGSLPADPTDRSQWLLHDDSWNWWSPERILSGLEFDNSTPGQLVFTLTMRTTSNLSGQTIYFRIWNSARTRAWIPVIGSIASCVVM